MKSVLNPELKFTFAQFNFTVTRSPDCPESAPMGRGVNQLTGSSTGLSRKLTFQPTGIGISTSRRDENWPMANFHHSWM